ncbi:DUF551 domain-containing protein [Escherichia coli]|nr:DUF551 domain-containing protein [Escherichia coli]
MLQGVEPASNHEELPLDYLQGQKDGLEWAAQLAEANHPQTGDWLYDDPVELAKAIRKGPDMPEAAGNSPVTTDGWISCSDAVPAEYCDVILLDDLGNVFPGSWDKVFCPTRGGNKMAFVDKDGVEVESSTHWMPLPEPPQEVK